MSHTHLLRNGHLRCGLYPGHLTTGYFLWPHDIRVTALEKNTTCPNCRMAVNLPPPEVSQVVEDAVEDYKEVMAATPVSERPAREAIAEALERGTTIGELLALAIRAGKEMAAQVSPGGTA